MKYDIKKIGEIKLKILGQLKDDILNGKAVLFLGAGASQGAGLYGSKDLANYLFKKTGSLDAFDIFRDDLSRLVSKIDKDPSFTRKWVDKHMIEYFTNRQNYTNLDTHKNILHISWKAVFTTNYDLSMEYADNVLEHHRYRLFPIVDPKESESISGSHEGKLKYFKINGCCNELERNPSSSPPLVITQSDFRQSIRRNQPFLEELKRYAYDCSIIFIGFQVYRAENNPILASIIETYSTLASSFHEPFKAFLVLKNVDQTSRLDIEDAGLTLLEGTFQEFIESIISLQTEKKGMLKIEDVDRKIYIKSAEKTVELTIGEYKQFSSQFSFYYDDYLNDEAKKLEAYPKDTIIDIWKAHPTDMILSKGYYITRDIFDDVANKLKIAITNVTRNRFTEIIVITGKRASGKSTLSRQLIANIYYKLRQPTLILSQQANYLDRLDEFKNSVSVSRWNAKQIDKFLSLFSTYSEEGYLTTIPVILADHLFHRINALDHLLDYLENHGKPCVLVLTLNQDEYDKLQIPSEPIDRLLQLYKYQNISIPHKLNDQEIEELFDVVSRLKPEIRNIRDILISKAILPEYCNRDILLILYTWFDKNFRRLDEIISDEIEKLETSKEIKNFYLSVAVFHQYNFSPRISICAESVGIGIDAFTNLRGSPIFKTLIDINNDIIEPNIEVASTRHSEFSRRILNKLVPESDKQVDLMCGILSLCGQSDLQFVRDFLLYICRYGALLTVEQVTRLKEATEKMLDKDYVLNHQFGAYLIREGINLDDARYYLDLASQENPYNSSINHSLGNLCYKLYKDKITDEPKKALEYYNNAKNYFAKSRTLENSREEHAYFTEISMIHHRINNFLDDDNTKILLVAERHALTLEALRVVPFERQNLLRISVDREVPFARLQNKDQQIVISKVMNGDASPLLLEYYAEGLLSCPNKENWHKLSEIVSLYWEIAKKDPSIATIICQIAKRGFIKNANSRFELLRSFFDKLIRYRDTKINFFLLAKYIRLIQIDALVLEKYDFLIKISGDIIDMFRDSKPRFLGDEFVLDKDYYCFDEEDSESSITYFEENINYSITENARRYKNITYIGHEHLKYFNVELDPISQYFIRGITKEVVIRGRVELNFCIKHRYDGFWAVDFRT